MLLAALAIITAVAALLRFHSLDARSFWFDEGVSVAIARLDWYNFARILWRREANMSLYYFLLHFWLHVGASEFFVRALSVLFAIASIPMIYFVGRRLFDARVGLIAAALLAVNAYHVQYSQDARSYSLMVFLCLVSSSYFLKTLAEPSLRNRATWVLSSALAVYAQFFSLLLVVAQWASTRMLDRERVPQQSRTDWLWISLLVSPIIVFAATTGTGPLRWVQHPQLKDLWVFSLHLTGNGGPILLATCLAMSALGFLPTPRSQPGTLTAWASWQHRFLLLWFMGPIGFTLLVSLAKPLFVPRYFTFCLPALLLLVASGVARLRFVWLKIAVVILLLALSFQGTAGYYKSDLDIHREDWRAAAQYLLSQAQPRDALLFHVPMGRMPYEFYRSLLRPTPASPVVLYPHHADDRLTYLDFVEKPDDAEIERRLSGQRRVWFVLAYAETPSGQPDSRSLELLGLVRSDFSLVGQREFSGIEILLYSRNTPAIDAAPPLQPRNSRP